MNILQVFKRLLQSNGHPVQQTTGVSNYEKGRRFEEYVIGLFDSKHFAVHDWTRDISGKFNGVVVESDANPDLVMRYRARDESIAVECKYRSALYRGKLDWTTEVKLRGYHAYMCKTHIPTFIVIGLGGAPDAPERLFCIPLAMAGYSKLFPPNFEKFERSPSQRFFWNGTTLL